ncbi:MAG: hypothetical protein AAF610_12650 [Pseudomonadota bacterium]
MKDISEITGSVNTRYGRAALWTGLIGLFLCASGCAPAPIELGQDIYSEVKAPRSTRPAVTRNDKADLAAKLAVALSAGAPKMDIVLRCISVVRKGGTSLASCYTTDEVALEIGEIFDRAAIAGRFVPARVNGYDVDAAVVFSVRVKVDDDVNVDVWMHHGHAADDGDRTYTAPQQHNSVARPLSVPTTCPDFELLHPMAHYVDARGQVTDILPHPALPADCEAYSLLAAKRVSYIPATRDGRAVAGVFPVLYNDKSAHFIWSAPGEVDVHAHHPSIEIDRKMTEQRWFKRQYLLMGPRLPKLPLKKPAP